MSIIERVNALGLPLDQIVVIGSGFLDALGLRTSRDIDLAVDPHLFALLKSDPHYNLSVKHGEEVLENGSVEIWQSWGGDESLQFDRLFAGGVTIDGIVFCHPNIIIARKQDRNLEKDRRDVQLLQNYLAAHPSKF